MTTISEKTTSSINADIIRAFDAMWGLHPSPVMMLKSNREIVAVNTAAQNLGIPLGIKCFQLTGKEQICDGCLGNAALKEQNAKRTASWQDKLNMFADTYWIPVQGEDGLFIHFGNDITPYTKEELCGGGDPSA